MSHVNEATHAEPVWRERADFIIAVQVDLAEISIATEQLWARKVGDREFEVCCIPFFAYNLALGDIVEVDDEYLVKRVTRPSGRFVFRVYFDFPHAPDQEETVRELMALGALVERSSPKLFAVDARDAGHAQDVADYLLELASRRVIVFETGKV